jgi:hypothetical protein
LVGEIGWKWDLIGMGLGVREIPLDLGMYIGACKLGMDRDEDIEISGDDLYTSSSSLYKATYTKRCSGLYHSLI